MELYKRHCEINYSPTLLDKRFDVQRWFWSASVDGVIANDAKGYTKTKWGAKHKARQWQRLNYRNDRRKDTSIRSEVWTPWRQW